jgi:hypothetical protein
MKQAPIFESLEQRVLLSSVPVTEFYIPDASDSDPEKYDLIRVTGGTPCKSDNQEIKNGEIATLESITLPLNGSLKIENLSDGVTDGDFRIMAMNTRKISLGKISGYIGIYEFGWLGSMSLEVVKVNDNPIGGFSISADKIGAISVNGDCHADIYSFGNIGTLSISGNYTGDIDSDGRIGKISVNGNYMGSISAKSTGTADISHSFIGNMKIDGNIDLLKAQHLGYLSQTNDVNDINVGGNIGTIQLGAKLPSGEYPEEENTSMYKCRISALKIGRINTGRDIINSQIYADKYSEKSARGLNSIGSITFQNLENSIIMAGSSYIPGWIGKISGNKIENSLIATDYIECAEGIFGIKGSSIGSVNVRDSVSGSMIYGADPDTFLLQIGKTKNIIKKGKSITDNGNDIRTLSIMPGFETKDARRAFSFFQDLNEEYTCRSIAQGLIYPGDIEINPLDSSIYFVQRVGGKHWQDIGNEEGIYELGDGKSELRYIGSVNDYGVELDTQLEFNSRNEMYVHSDFFNKNELEVINLHDNSHLELPYPGTPIYDSVAGQIRDKGFDMPSDKYVPALEINPDSANIPAQKVDYTPSRIWSLEEVIGRVKSDFFISGLGEDKNGNIYITLQSSKQVTYPGGYVSNKIGDIIMISRKNH